MSDGAEETICRGRTGAVLLDAYGRVRALYEKTCTKQPDREELVCTFGYGCAIAVLSWAAGIPFGLIEEKDVSNPQVRCFFELQQALYELESQPGGIAK